METRRGEVKSWDKEAGARLPGAFSGLAAASGFLGVHREPPGPPLGLSGWGEGPKGQSTQSSQETSCSAAPRHSCQGLSQAAGGRHWMLREHSSLFYACVSGDLGERRGTVNSAMPPHLQTWANRNESGGDSSLEAHSMQSYPALWAGQKQWK